MSDLPPRSSETALENGAPNCLKTEGTVEGKMGKMLCSGEQDLNE